MTTTKTTNPLGGATQSQETGSKTVASDLQIAASQGSVSGDQLSAMAATLTSGANAGTQDVIEAGNALKWVIIVVLLIIVGILVIANTEVL